MVRLLVAGHSTGGHVQATGAPPWFLAPDNLLDLLAIPGPFVVGEWHPQPLRKLTLTCCCLAAENLAWHKQAARMPC